MQAELLAAIVRVDGKVDELAVLAPTVKRLVSEVERLDKGIRGNGRPGLVSRVAALESGIGAIDRRVDDLDGSGVTARLKLRGEGLRKAGRVVVLGLLVTAAIAGLVDSELLAKLLKIFAP